MMAWNLWDLNSLFWWQLQAIFLRILPHCFLFLLKKMIWVIDKVTQILFVENKRELSVSILFLRWWSHWALSSLLKLFILMHNCCLESYIWSLFFFSNLYGKLGLVGVLDMRYESLSMRLFFYLIIS